MPASAVPTVPWAPTPHRAILRYSSTSRLAVVYAFGASPGTFLAAPGWGDGWGKSTAGSDSWAPLCGYCEIKLVVPRGGIEPPAPGFSDAARVTADVRQRPSGTHEWPP